MIAAITLILALISPSVKAAGTGCQDTTGTLVLEKVRATAVGTQIIGCVNRSFDALSSSAAMTGSTSTGVRFGLINVSTIAGNPSSLGVHFTSVAVFESSATFQSGSVTAFSNSSFTLLAPSEIKGLVGNSLTASSFTSIGTIQSGTTGNGVFKLGGAPSGGGTTGKIQFVTSNSQTNWQISNNTFLLGAIELTPSTSGGGSTFSTPALVLDSSGNGGLGTGTGSVGSRFHVKDSASASPYITVEGSGGSALYGTRNTNEAFVQATTVRIETAGGGLGKVEAAHAHISSGPVRVAGTGAKIIFPDGTEQITASFAGSGDVVKSATQTLTGINTISQVFVSSHMSIANGASFGYGSVASPGLINTMQDYVFARSTDGATQSSGCIVSVAFSPNSPNAVAVFTSTVTSGLNFVSVGAFPGILLETCAPGETCRVGTSGFYWVSVQGSINNQTVQTTTTRCQGAANNLLNESTVGIPVSGGGNISGQLWIKLVH